MNRKDNFSALIRRFLDARNNGLLHSASEETVRMWINDMLEVFGWDVNNTRQVMQERILGRFERERLHDIGSRYIKPDYTMVNGNTRLFFIDAKKQSVDIKNDKKVAFQIRSYGWSIGAPYSIVTDFDEIAIYDCTAKPNASDTADFARLYYLTVEQYIENYELFEQFLNRDNVLKEFADVEFRGSNTLDKGFALFLSDIRLELAKSIRKNNHFEISVSDLNLNKQFLDPVPFPVQSYQEMSPDMVQLANVARQIEQLHTIMSTSSSRASRYVPAVKRLWNELDTICCRLYQLSEEEKNIVMSHPRNDRNYA